MFLIVSLLYASTGPSPYYFTLLLRSYTGLRIAYSVAYKLKAKPPARSVIYSLALYFIHLPMILVILYSSMA